jgi:hypothetical protein
LEVWYEQAKAEDNGSGSLAASLEKQSHSPVVALGLSRLMEKVVLSSDG